MVCKGLTHCSATARRAFTLVELLVVVSIIALLIAILLPSLKKAREAAKRIACNSDLRGNALAGLTYAADDRSEFAIPVGEGDAIQTIPRYSYYGFGGKSGRGGAGGARGSIWGGKQLMGSPHRPLNAIVYKRGFSPPSDPNDWSADTRLKLDSYRCAADRTFNGMHYLGWKNSQISSYDYFGTSYCANPLFVGVPGAGNPLQSNAIYGRPMSRVPNPSNTVLYWENAARFAFFASNPEEYDQSGCYWPYQLGSRPIEEYVAHGHHGQDWFFNVSFGDGHASFIKIKGHGRMDANFKMPWNCRPPHPSCECILIRGRDWQLDTLPAELVDTNKTRQAGSSRMSTADGSGTDFDIVP